MRCQASFARPAFVSVPETVNEGYNCQLNRKTPVIRARKSSTYVIAPYYYSSHPTFDRLAEDWIAILDLQIPAYDAIPHIVTMTGLHLILYQLQRASEVLALDEPITMVCEIVSPKRSVVRDLSADSFQGNNALPQQALERFVREIA